MWTGSYHVATYTIFAWYVHENQRRTRLPSSFNVLYDKVLYSNVFGPIPYQRNVPKIGLYGAVERRFRHLIFGLGRNFYDAPRKGPKRLGYSLRRRLRLGRTAGPGIGPTR